MTASRGDDSGPIARGGARTGQDHQQIRHARRAGPRGEDARKLSDYFIVDIDAHVTETAFWSEITDRIDNDYCATPHSRSGSAAARRRAC